MVALVENLIKLVGNVIPVCKQTCEFTHQFAVLAMHFERNLLPMLENVKRLQHLSPSVEQLLKEYETLICDIMNAATIYRHKSFLGRAATRRSKQAELENMLEHLTPKENCLNTLLHLPEAEAIPDISKLLAQGKEKDIKNSNNIEDLGRKLEAFMEEAQENNVYGAKKIMTFFKDVAADFEARGTSSDWLQSAAAFRSLVQTLKGDAQRGMLKDLHKGVAASLDRIELIKAMTLDTLEEVGEQLKALPSDFKQKESAQTLIQNLVEQKQRVSDLCLTVSLIGPVKSGKTTTINAIMGRTLFPSDTLPLTVMPTTVKHCPRQEIPRLLLQESTKLALEAACREIKAKVEEIREDCVCTSVELRYLDTIAAPYTFLPLKDFAVFEDLREELALMNHICRIYARAVEMKVLDGENPLLQIVVDRSWPVVLYELDLLKGEHLVGSFELVDTPGRDETDLIPEIKGAVTEAIAKAAAVVCVINSQTAMTNSMYAIKKELRATLKYDLPVYLLANKIDGLQEGKRIPELELEIGRAFLEDKYDSTTQQVFGVSSMHAISWNMLNRARSRPDFMQLLKALPNLVDEDGSLLDDTSPFRWPRDQILMLLSFVKKANGDEKWKRQVKKLDEEEVDEDLQSMWSKTRFAAFKTKLMKELAPKAGQTVLQSQIGDVLKHLQDLLISMDRYVTGMLATAEDFTFQQQKLTALIHSFEEAIQKELKPLLDSYLKRIKASITSSCKRLHEDAGRLVHETIDQIAKDGVAGFTLSLPPSKDELESSPHLQYVSGKKYWEVSRPSLHAKLQQTLRSHMQEAIADVFEECKEQLQPMLQKLQREFCDALLAAVQARMSSEDLLSVTSEDLRLRMTPLKLPDEELGQAQAQKYRRRTWKNLWIVPLTKVIGTTYLLPLEEARNCMLRQVAEMVEMVKLSMKDQCVEQLTKTLSVAEATFTNRIAEVKKEVELVAQQRKHIGKSKEMIAPVAKSRVLCEGLYTELWILLQFVSDTGEKTYRIKKDLTSTEAAIEALPSEEDPNVAAGVA